MFGKEVPGAKDCANQMRNIVIALTKRLGQWFQERFGRLSGLAHEIAIELADKESSASWLFHNDSHDVFAVPLARLTEERLRLEVVRFRIEIEVFAGRVPAGES